jgi:hypothetical protein
MCPSESSNDQKVVETKKLLHEQLPPQNYEVLKYLLQFLTEVSIQQSSTYAMIYLHSRVVYWEWFIEPTCLHCCKEFLMNRNPKITQGKM